MIIGKLYLLKQYCWFLFPTKEVAVWADEKAWGAWRRTSSAAKSAAKWLSDHYNCNASVIEENIYVVLLEVDDEFIKVLDSNGNIGWTSGREFSKYIEIVKE